MPRSNFTCEEAKKTRAPGGEYALMNWGWGDTRQLTTTCESSSRDLMTPSGLHEHQAWHDVQKENM